MPAAKKKSSTTGTNTRSKRTQDQKRKKTIATIGAIFLYCLFLIVIFLSFYSELLGIVGTFIKNIFLGLLGITAYFLVFAMLFGIIYYLHQKRKKAGYPKIYAMAGSLAGLSAMIHLFTYGQGKNPIRVDEFYQASVLGSGGGVVGGFIAEPLKYLSFVGAFIILLLLMMFTLFIVFYEPIVKFFEDDDISERNQDTPDKKRKNLFSLIKKKKRTVKEESETREQAPPEPVLAPQTNFDKIMEIYHDYETMDPDTQDMEKVIRLVNPESEKEESEEEELKRIIDAVYEEEAPEESFEAEERVEKIVLEPDHKKVEYKYPSVDLLDENKQKKTGRSKDQSDLKGNALRLENILSSFGVEAQVVNIEKGPSITRYELQPKAGVRLSKIQSLQDDIKMNLAAFSIRIAPIPGKTVVGVEVPNDKTSMVYLRDIIASKEFQNHSSKIAFSVGMDITGKPIVGDLAKMPHILIAGSTGSGKSVCINNLITSILYKANPNEVKLIMIDPKVVELGVYDGIPHLHIPVVTDPAKAAGALNWAVMEMQERYKLFAEAGVRNIEGYNELMASEHQDDMFMPKYVIIIDELADLMMVAAKDVESYICRLAQLARAAGMHLVIATQRPSVNVITGLIKANVPSRVAFAVSSQVDSRTILDMGGAEKLLGKGDMLYYPVGSTKPMRVQGSFISDKEVERIVNVVKSNSTAEYDENTMEYIDRAEVYQGNEKSKEDEANEADEKLNEAIEAILDANQASTSFLQRRLSLGYARAARIVDQMEKRGVVGPSEGGKGRQILITREQFYEMQMRDQ